ncbi:MAG: glutamine--tRNA ligase/YqeY domain fusion protein [Polyangiaceae bacterium]|nr:glutamine--tRNA ligase/YqeY domain fusion protein [Polyangiaceae bacterium]
METSSPSDFIRDIVAHDLETNKHGGRVVTRFPPEPNGYLHIGHAKSICLNFGIALQNNGTCHLRFDDTNPTGESMEYVESIQRDVRWLGFDWAGKMFFASDYFEQLYEFAEELIRAGKAYVCSLSEEEIREYRGTITEPGRPSPYRDRPVAENLDLLRRMRAGEFPEGAHVLRAKIDMASANMKMRDPLMYRIRYSEHYRTGNRWCIYPLYDFTHCLSDALEHITHSICTLEFENNRELYDWFIDNVSAPSQPRQIEFARLNLTYTVMSKRRLLELVKEHHVLGWDDPRMPTLSGLRRRGITPSAIRAFAERIGVARNNSTVDMALLEHCVREDLNATAPRVMCVLSPLKVTIEDFPAEREEVLDVPYFPPDVARQGSRPVPFCRELYIERDDFELEPPPGYYRLAPGRQVRLRHAYVIRCERAIADPTSGEVTELVCTYDPDSLGQQPQGRRVKGTIQWVSARHAQDVEVRLYDRLFRSELPGADGTDFKEDINPDSLKVVRGKVEPAAAQAEPGSRLQFERQGFFCADAVDSMPGRPVFNRIVSLKDTWAKIAARSAGASTETVTSGTERGGRDAVRPEEKASGTAVEREIGSVARQLCADHGIGAEEARVLGDDPALRTLFEQAIKTHPNARMASVLIVHELRALLRGSVSELPFQGSAIGELVRLVDQKTLSATLAKSVLGAMVAGEGAPQQIVRARGLGQISDRAELGRIIDAVIAEQSSLVARYRAGNQSLLGALVGAVMRKAQGQANPKLTNELLLERLNR